MKSNTNYNKSHSERFGLGQRIKLSIDCVGITQKKLSELTGLSPSSIVDYIKEKHLPSSLTVVDIAEKCSVDSGWLLNGAIDSYLGYKIKLVRGSAEKSVEEFALQINTSVQFVQAAENGTIVPSLSWLEKVMRKFGIDESYFSGTDRNTLPFDDIIRLLHDDPFAAPEILKILRARKEQREASKRLLS
jgi:transcriptional regulator with XRE-family HTH domain